MSKGSCSKATKELSLIPETHILEEGGGGRKRRRMKKRKKKKRKRMRRRKEKDRGRRFHEGFT